MTVRMVQVGIGGWGHDWVNVAQRSADVELVGLVDLNPDALVRAQQSYNIPATHCFPSLDAALAGTDADAVLVTTFLAAHVPVALQALRAGKHVLIEKPFAPSLAEAQQVIDAAQQAGCIAMISQNYRFFPAVQVAAALVRGGTLGDVGDVTVDFRFPQQNRLPAGSPYFTSVHPLLTDMAIHHFDLMRAVLGQEPVQIDCRTWNPSWTSFRDPPAASAIITFERGTIVTYHGSWISPASRTPWAGEWRMTCAGGEITWTSRKREDGVNDRVAVQTFGKAVRRVDLPAFPALDRYGSLRALVHAIETQEEPATSVRDNIKSLALMFAAVESAQTGQTVKLIS